MSNTDIEIVVDDPTAPEANSPAVTSNRIVDVVVCLLLLAIALTLGLDNWRTGAGWESTGPQAGYFPFYLSIILGAASLYGIVAAFLSRKEAAETFVTRAQLRRVLAVFVPTVLFVLAIQFLGHLCREFPADLRLHAAGRQDRAVEVAAHRLRLHRRDVHRVRRRV